MVGVAGWLRWVASGSIASAVSCELSLPQAALVRYTAAMAIAHPRLGAAAQLGVKIDFMGLARIRVS